jgi:hypothetical protein
MNALLEASVVYLLPPIIIGILLLTNTFLIYDYKYSVKCSWLLI